MRRIKLTRGQFALVDDEDYAVLNKVKWYARWSKATQSFYVCRGAADATHKRGQVTQLMHRVILDAKKGQLIDHRNHDTLDNRRSNIRIVTPTENMANKRKYKNNTSGYKGVCRSGGKWQARVDSGGKTVNLGLFKTAKEAGLAYNEEATRLFGEFALLNNI